VQGQPTGAAEIVYHHLILPTCRNVLNLSYLGPACRGRSATHAHNTHMRSRDSRDVHGAEVREKREREREREARNDSISSYYRFDISIFRFYQPFIVFPLFFFYGFSTF